MAEGGAGGRLRLLLDTTYLLPTLGVEVEGLEQVLEALYALRRKGLVELYYSGFSLLEACAKAAKLGVPEHVLEAGVTAIVSGYRHASPTVEAWLLAVRLRRDGLSDFIDAVLYATAASTGLRLLTRDARLVRFLSERGYPVQHVVSERELEEYAARALKGPA